MRDPSGRAAGAELGTRRRGQSADRDPVLTDYDLWGAGLFGVPTVTTGRGSPVTLEARPQLALTLWVGHSWHVADRMCHFSPA